jgi:hypothetical protein
MKQVNVTEVSFSEVSKCALEEVGERILMKMGATEAE